MKIDPKRLRLYAVTDRAWTHDAEGLLRQVAAAVDGGAGIVQLREKHLGDDVPEEVKSRRLSEIIALQNELGHASNLRDVGREFEVLVEGESKRDRNQLSGRTSQNKVVVFDRGYHRVGDYVRVRITGLSLIHI